jgi:Zn-dependent M28 family amino/carboxypeptidase
MRMWIPLVLLGACAVLIVLSVVAYRVMIDVKPEVNRPTSRTDPSEIAALQDRLMGHVRMLGDTIGERHVSRPQALQAAVDYIRQVWTSQGWSVSTEPFEVAGGPVVNVVVEQKGAGRPEAIVVVGAHYDTAPGSPGANDNGTGVALLLETARALKDETLHTTLRYVAFVNEESPYYFTEHMGSRVHARRARQRGDHIVGMISLETLGYYSSARGTQRYPFPLGLFYPDSGNFLAVVANVRSRALVQQFLRHFTATSDFPVEGAATFQWIPGVSWSDHWSFWTEGYPALMLTDTAPFRYPEYHSSIDHSDRITPKAFAGAADGIIRAIRGLTASPQEGP